MSWDSVFDLTSSFNFLIQSLQSVEQISVFVFGKDGEISYYFDTCEYSTWQFDTLSMEEIDKASTLYSIRLFNSYLPYLAKGYAIVNLGVIVMLWVYFKVWFIILFTIYCVLLGYSVWGNIHSGEFIAKVNYSYLGEIEGEYGAAHDYIPYLCVMATMIAWYYLFNIFLHYFTRDYLNTFFVCWFLLTLTTLAIPGATLAGFGMRVAHYVRGVGKSSNLIVEVMLDTLAIMIIFLRFFIQNIRFFLIFAAFFELYEFVYNTFIDDLIMRYNIDKSYQENKDRYLGLVGAINIHLIWIGITYLYYTIHLTALYLMQIVIYTLLSFWLFCFLFTSFALVPGEKYFFYKRHNL